jgi:hypothetical protein
MKRAKKPPVYHFEVVAPLSDAAVDSENGVIKGVSIITCGVEARGHDLEVDDTTVSQMFLCANGMGQVPVKWNHKSGADAINGYLSNFSVEGNKLKGDWHLLKTHAQYDQAIELAERMPKNFGLSAAFAGQGEKKGGKTKARCTELISVDLVANPAANPDGLFEAVDTSGDGMDQEPTLADVLAAVQQVQSDQAAITERLDAAEQFQNDLIDQFADEGEGNEEIEDGVEYEYIDEAGNPVQVGTAVNGGAPNDIASAPGTLTGTPGAPAGAPAMAGAAATSELAALRQTVTYLAEKDIAETEAAEKAEREHAFAVVDQKIDKLVEFNTKLKAENEALVTALQTAGASAAHLSAPARGPVTHLSAHDGEPADEWEELVHEFQSQDKDMPPTKAIQLAIQQRPDLYQTHLGRIGVVNQMGS